MFDEYPEILTVDQLAKALRICKSRAYDLVHKNIVPHFAYGHIYRIPKFALIQYLEKETGFKVPETKTEQIKQDEEPATISEDL